MGDVHGKVFIWNISEKKCLWDIQAHDGRVNSLHVSIRIEETYVPKHGANISCFALVSSLVSEQVDSIRVVTGGSDGFIRVLDIMTGRAVQSFQV